MRAARALAVLAAVVAAGVAPAAPAAGQSGDCLRVGPDGKCTVWNGGERGHGPGGDGGRPSGPPVVCGWLAFVDQAEGRALFPNPPTDQGLIVYEDCGRGGVNGHHDPWERVGYTGPIPNFIGPGFVIAPTAPPPPDQVAVDVWASVEGTLPAPELITNPPVGIAAIIRQPTFVAVGNWTPVSANGCDPTGVVCVTLTAIPELTFEPGDGSATITCEGAGTVYDPAGPEPAVQAEGACAHVYERRTGGSRPGAWPGTVTVTWEVSWTSTTPDADGTLPPFSLSATLARQVDEVHGVVVDGRAVLEGRG